MKQWLFVILAVVALIVLGLDAARWLQIRAIRQRWEHVHARGPFHPNQLKGENK